MGYCTSCGSPIPDGQGSSCSMCCGDPYYGKDGYYMDWLEKQQQKEMEQKQLEEKYMEEQMEKDALKKLKMEEHKELLMAFAEEFIFGWTDASDDQVEKRIDNFLKEYHAQD